MRRLTHTCVIGNKSGDTEPTLVDGALKLASELLDISAMSWCIVRDPVAMKSVEWDASVGSLSPVNFTSVLEEMDRYTAGCAISSASCKLIVPTGSPMVVRIFTDRQLPAFCSGSADGEFSFQLAILPDFQSKHLQGQRRIISFGSRFAIMTGEVTEQEIREALSRIAAFYLPDLGIMPLCGSLTRQADGNTTLYLGRSEFRNRLLQKCGEQPVSPTCELGWSAAGLFTLDPNETVLYNHPTNVVFVIADETGVMPPVSMLTSERAAYYFLGGCHGQEPQGFHLCFGNRATFRSKQACAAIMKRRLEANRPRCWMLNLGALGGPHGKPIEPAVSTSLLKAALNGTLARMSFQFDSNFHVLVPVCCPGVSSAVLDQRANWMHPGDYDLAAKSAADFLAHLV